MSDYLRNQASDRLQTMPPEELRQLVESSAQVSPLPPGDRIDLEAALEVLSRSKPECRDFLLEHFVIGLDYCQFAGKTSHQFAGEITHL